MPRCLLERRLKALQEYMQLAQEEYLKEKNSDERWRWRCTINYLANAIYEYKKNIEKNEKKGWNY